VAVVDRHLIKRLSLATEDLVEAGRIVGKLDIGTLRSPGRASELAVFDALLYIRIRRIDEPA
jgi:hypothetical protein